MALISRHQDVPNPPVVDAQGRFVCPIRVRGSGVQGFSFASGQDEKGRWGAIVPDLARLNVQTGLFERIVPRPGMWSTNRGLRMCCDDMSTFTIAGKYAVSMHGDPKRCLGAHEITAPFTQHPLSVTWNMGPEADNSGNGYNSVVVADGMMFHHAHSSATLVALK